MEVDWSKIELTKEFLKSKDFRYAIKYTLGSTWPLECGFDENWTKMYDHWHRHLTPLSDFVMPIDEAIDRFGCLHFSAEEDPVQVGIYLDEQEEYYINEKARLENDVKRLEIKLENIEDEFELSVIQDELESTERSLKYLFNPQAVLRKRELYRDVKLRQELIDEVGDRKSDLRYYLMTHQCFDNARGIWLAVMFHFPLQKWKIVTSNCHALVTSGTPEELESYLFKNGHEGFWIAEPMVQGRESIANLMPHPERWVTTDDKDEILTYEFPLELE